jgi:hypothetical protein
VAATRVPSSLSPRPASAPMTGQGSTPGPIFHIGLDPKNLVSASLMRLYVSEILAILGYRIGQRFIMVT